MHMSVAFEKKKKKKSLFSPTIGSIAIFICLCIYLCVCESIQVAIDTPIDYNRLFRQ